MVPRAGLSIPRIRPWMRRAAAMMAPELPADTQAETSPLLHSRAHTLIEESGLERTACAGWSLISTTWLAGTKRRRGCESSRRWTRSGAPTTATSTPRSRAASEAPRTTCSGAKSPPIPSIAMRKGAVLSVSSDVEVAHSLGVRGDEFLARLYVAAHQLFEDVVDGSDVLDLHLQKGPGGRVHRGIPELLSIHLAEALEAADLHLPPHPLELSVTLVVTVDPLRLLALRQLVQRRLRHVDVALVDQVRKMPVEECEQERTDMRAVDIGVGHRDHPVVAEPVIVEALADTGTQGRDQVSDLF